MEHIFRQWIGMHRAMIAWFHAAHHVTKGTGFGGDHVNIYGEIYTTLDEDLDQIVEKGIGLTGDESLADPVSSLSMAAGLLAQQPASANQDAETIACNAFEVIKYYVKSIEGIYAQFEACGMSLGLDDLLQGLANQYETYVYLLQQRSRTVSLNKSPIIAITESRLRKTIRRVLKEAAGSGGFTVSAEKENYIEAPDGELLKIEGPRSPRVIVGNQYVTGSIYRKPNGKIALITSRYDEFFSNLQDLCDYLNEEELNYEGIDNRY